MDADFHLGCDSIVRVSPEDLTGPFGYLFEWGDHLDYPQVKVGTCELAAEHTGRCEMFVEAGTDDTLQYWLTWQRIERSNRLCTTYDWLTASALCNAESPNEHRCTRPVDHRGGHSFTAHSMP
jgi:hypothetical protein